MELLLIIIVLIFVLFGEKIQKWNAARSADWCVKNVPMGKDETLESWSKRADSLYNSHKEK